jgi:hypothetical protein
MPKYAHIFDGKIVTKYEADAPKRFGGPWADGESIEIPENFSEVRTIYVDGFLQERPKTQEELNDETTSAEIVQFKQNLAADIEAMSNLADAKAILRKIGKAIVRIAR